MRSICMLFIAMYPFVHSAADVVCEDRNGDRIIEDFVCPLGYLRVGEYTQNSGDTTQSSLGEALRERTAEIDRRTEERRQARLERQAAAAEAERQRNFEAQQAAERLRQQAIRNSSLPDSARCLVGAWLIKRIEGTNQEGLTLDISDDGKVYLGGFLVNGYPNSHLLLANNTVDINLLKGNGASSRLRLKLENNLLIGSITLVQVKEGFWGDKKLPAETYETRGERTNQAPVGCTVAVDPSDPGVTSRGETIANGLKNLSELYNQGTLTEEEFNAAKRRLLGL